MIAREQAEGAGIGRGVGDAGAVDLQDVDGEMSDLAERGVAGTEALVPM
jgi:hypothetical protein